MHQPGTASGSLKPSAGPPSVSDRWQLDRCSTPVTVHVAGSMRRSPACAQTTKSDLPGVPSKAMPEEPLPDVRRLGGGNHSSTMLASSRSRSPSTMRPNPGSSESASVARSFTELSWADHDPMRRIAYAIRSAPLDGRSGAKSTPRLILRLAQGQPIINFESILDREFTQFQIRAETGDRQGPRPRRAQNRLSTKRVAASISRRIGVAHI